MIVLGIGVAAMLAVVGYMVFGRTKAKAAIAADAARETNAALKLAAYLKYCADNNVKPYKDMAQAKAMLT